MLQRFKCLLTPPQTLLHDANTLLVYHASSLLESPLLVPSLQGYTSLYPLNTRCLYTSIYHVSTIDFTILPPLLTMILLLSTKIHHSSTID